tara:strand:+ start:204 stop:677 length:474 start_codon:yes stop_codon:yes gene_type:complete
MAIFSKRSVGRLNGCHSDLVILFEEVVVYFDCTIIEGQRGEAKQNKAYNDGNSKLRFPFGKHNADPSIAVDVSPYPIDWKDRERFHYFAGYVMGVAYRLLQEGQIKNRIRFGGDWDRDTNLKNNSFDDLLHFELYPLKDSKKIIEGTEYKTNYKGRR